MSNTYTPNTKLAMPAIGDTGWSVPVNGNVAALDALTPLGGLAVTTHEQPSSTLNVDIAAGTFIKQDFSVGTYAGVSSSPMTASTTTAIYLDGTNSYALAKAASYPSTPHVRLATVAAGASTINTVTDNRQVCGVTSTGQINDGVSWAVGVTTGLTIGTAVTQKLGFFGTTPAVQPTLGSATATVTYGTNEQGMLQRVYNAVRTLGLGS